MVITASDLRVRPATAEDERLLLTWRNDPSIVVRALTQRTVTPEEHHRWFQATLARPDRELYLVETGAGAAGMIRFDVSDGEAEVSIYLLPPFPGKGLGSRVFWSTAPDLLLRRNLRRLTATVRLDNERSLAFFRKLGFVPLPLVRDAEANRLVLERSTIPHSRPWVGREEADAAASVVLSGQLAQGPAVAALEKRWCKATATSEAAAVASGLSALRLSLVALGVGPNDEVILPAYSCVALANAVLSLGAKPVLADVEDDAWTIDVADARRRVTGRTRAVIAVHLFGAPADLAGLEALGVPIIEDCAHGIGGRCGTVRFGSGGTLSTGSFYATKMLCAGEGGIVASRDDSLVQRVRQARDYDHQAPDGRHLNDKMSDVTAAVANVQLGRLQDALAHRARVASGYRLLLAALADRGLIDLPPEAPGRIWYRYAVRLKRHRAAAIMDVMSGLGVRSQQPVWDLRSTSVWSENLRTAAEAFDHVVSLPLYPDLTELEQRLVCRALEAALQ